MATSEREVRTFWAVPGASGQTLYYWQLRQAKVAAGGVREVVPVALWSLRGHNVWHREDGERVTVL